MGLVVRLLIKRCLLKPSPWGEGGNRRLTDEVENILNYNYNAAFGSYTSSVSLTLNSFPWGGSPLITTFLWRGRGTAERRWKERKNKLTTIISLRENYQFALQTLIVSAAKPLIVCRKAMIVINYKLFVVSPPVKTYGFASLLVRQSLLKPSPLLQFLIKRCLLKPSPWGEGGNRRLTDEVENVSSNVYNAAFGGYTSSVSLTLNSFPWGGSLVISYQTAFSSAQPKLAVAIGNNLATALAVI